MSLRARLLFGLAVLVALGIGAAGVVTYEEQRSFLFERLDEQVSAAQFPVAASLGVLKPRVPPLRRGPVVPPAGARGPATFQASGTYGLLLVGRRIIESRSFIYGEAAPSAPKLPGTFPVSQSPSRLRLFTVDSRGGAGLRYRAAALRIGRGRIMVVAVPLREVDQTLHRLVVVEGLVGGGVILALLLLGSVVIQLGLRPLQRMGRVASEIAEGNFSRRVSPASSRTEVGRLGLSLNGMLVQIERAFADRTESEDRLRQFLADASHELRTPLASIRGYAEAFRLGAASDPDTLERAMARIESEAARMGVLVEDLLLLANLDEMPKARRRLVDLYTLAEQAAQDMRAVAPTREVRFTGDHDVPVLADPDQLRQVLANLTRNAQIHTPPDSPVELSVHRRSDRWAVLEVRDHGRGLPVGAGDRVFDRFWRIEPGRQRGPGGAGLGLAIVKAIALAHHGGAQAANAPDGGAIFRVTLPVADRSLVAPEPLADDSARFPRQPKGLREARARAS